MINEWYMNELVLFDMVNVQERIMVYIPSHLDEVKVLKDRQINRIFYKVYRNLTYLCKKKPNLQVPRVTNFLKKLEIFVRNSIISLFGRKMGSFSYTKMKIKNHMYRLRWRCSKSLSLGQLFKLFKFQFVSIKIKHTSFIYYYFYFSIFIQLNHYTFCHLL